MSRTASGKSNWGVLAAIVDHLKIAILQVTRGIITSWNRGASGIWLSANEIIGKSVPTVPARTSAEVDEIWHSQAGESIRSVETRRRNRVAVY